MIEYPVTDLPEPDSPTRPSASPRATLKLTSSTALTTPALVMKWVRRPLDAQHRVGHRCSLGLTTSRN
jgi:hypothetical protein